jgi:hypothetical protein
MSRSSCAFAVRELITADAEGTIGALSECGIKAYLVGDAQ